MCHYVCNYWTRHPHYWFWWYEECECYKKYWIHYLEFYKFLLDKWYKIDYPSDIKPHMQALFFKQKNEQTN